MSTPKSSARQRADAIKAYRCKNLIAVLEDPIDFRNIGTVIRNVNALGVEKTYIVDPRKSLPDDWQDLRRRKSISATSVAAIQWSFVRRFDSTAQCLEHLEKKRFTSIVTSPHIKGRENFVLHEADYTHPRLAVWFGNESRGVSNLAIEHSEFCVSIPMFGMVEKPEPGNHHRNRAVRSNEAAPEVPEHVQAGNPESEKAVPSDRLVNTRRRRSGGLGPMLDAAGV
jgi:tRNA (guanosine-2'-O-)-methyltransferase